MKALLKNKFLYVFASLLLLAFSSVIATAQPFVPAKAAVIQSDAFYDEKAGITKLVKSSADVVTEFKPRQTELINLSERLKKLSAEIKAIQDTINNGGPPVDKTIQLNLLSSKEDEAQHLQLVATRKKDDAEAAFAKRQQEVTVPILDDVGKALGAYARSHGIDIVIDSSKVDGVYLFNSAADITDAFIADYNAKHAAP